MRALILTLLLLMIPACQNQKQDEIEITILIDKTDDFIGIKDLKLVNIVPELTELHENTNMGMTLTIKAITDVVQNRTYRYTLPSVSPIISNEIERKNAIKKFKQEAEAGFNEIKNIAPLRSSSPIFETLSDAFKNSKSPKRKIILISDLAQNSERLSLYGKGELQKEMLDQFFGTIRGQGTEIVFQFESRNSNEDGQFRKVAHLLSAYFEHKGMHVIITSGVY